MGFGGCIERHFICNGDNFNYCYAWYADLFPIEMNSSSVSFFPLS
jgi:hypothetical protein